MSGPGTGMSRAATRVLRRHLVGPRQRWAFAPPPAGWTPPPVERTSLYLHVPFCRDRCPYCPYTTVPYREDLVEGWERAALAETDLWAAAVGPAEVTSIYIGGGTPTLALESVARVLERMRARFRLTGDVCIETNPSAVDEALPERLRAAGVSLVSLGVESFQARHLRTVGRRYTPRDAEEALARLAGAGFAGLNADLMIALPGQTAADVVSDLDRAAELGAGQITVYPLFTFPYTAVGAYRRRTGVGMPRLAARHEHYRAVTAWAARRGYRRVSVWSFRRGDEPRYSSVTRDGYLGVGPGAGSHLPDGFVLNTFDLAAWEERPRERRAARRPAHAVLGPHGGMVVALLAVLRHAHPSRGAGRRARRRRGQGAPLAAGDRVRRSGSPHERRARPHRRRILLAPPRPEPLRARLRRRPLDRRSGASLARDDRALTTARPAGRGAASTLAGRPSSPVPSTPATGNS